LLNKISYFEEMRQGLVKTQHCLHELKEHEREHKLKKQRKWAVQAAGNQLHEAAEPHCSEMSTRRTGRSLSHAARPLSRPARSQSCTAVDLLSTDVPEVPPVDMSRLISMAIKEEDQEANTVALEAITERGLERAARKAERRERIVREDAERAEKDRAEKEQKKAEINAELQALMAKKAGLEKPTKPKTEPVEETVVSATFLYDFVVPAGFHMEGQYLVQDDEQLEENKNINYELEYE
jgi:hypothetical protein